MTPPNEVRDAAERLLAIEDVTVARDAVLVSKWRETVLAYAIPLILNPPEVPVDAIRRWLEINKSQMETDQDEEELRTIDEWLAKMEDAE